jgi:hypothetical protein
MGCYLIISPIYINCHCLLKRTYSQWLLGLRAIWNLPEFCYMRLFNDTQNIDVYNANLACLSAHFIWSISHSNFTGNWGIQWQELAVVFICMRSVLFWDSTQFRMVVSYRRFGKTYRSHLQGSSSISCIAEPLKVGPIRYFETSVRTCHSTARKIPKEDRYHSHRGGSLKFTHCICVCRKRVTSSPCVLYALPESHTPFDVFPLIWWSVQIMQPVDTLINL